MKKGKIGKALAIGGIVVGSLLAGGLSGYVVGDNGIDADTVAVAKEAAYSEGVNSVEVPVCAEPIVCPEPEVQNVTVEVPVEDLTFVELACDKLVYDDVAECKEEVVAEDAALRLAILEIEDNFADELEDEDIVRDEDDVEIVRIYDDADEIEVLRSDFDDEEYRFEIKVKINDDDKKKYVLFKVDVEDGEADIRNVEEA